MKMTTLARTEMLERKLDRHMRTYVDEIKTFRNELQISKVLPKRKAQTSAKDQRTPQRPLNGANKKVANISKLADMSSTKIIQMSVPQTNMSSTESLKKVQADGKSLNANNYYSGGRMTNKKMVSGAIKMLRQIFHTNKKSFQ